jgi:glycogen(starch) synthase
MRVLLTCCQGITWPQPGHDLWAEVAGTSASLAQLGVQVTTATSGPGKGDLRCMSQRVRFLSAPLLHVIPMSRLEEMHNEALLQSNLSLLARIISLRLEGEGVDLVHCFGWEAGLASGLFCQLTGVPLVCALRDVIRQRVPWLADDRLAYARQIARWLIRRSRRLICPDQYARDKIQDLFLVKDEDVVVLPPLMATHDAGEGMSHPQKSRTTILYAGPLGRQSGVDDLLTACRRLIARRAGQLQLVLATSDQSAQALLVRKTIRKLNLAQHVRFASHLGPGRFVRQQFRHIKLLVLPGEVEFVGNLVFEALANGVPVVAADSGALAGVIENGVNGLKFPGGHAGSLAEALEAALFDRKFHRQMARGARQQARRRPQVGPRLLKIYQEACAGPGTLAGKGG